MAGFYNPFSPKPDYAGGIQDIMGQVMQMLMMKKFLGMGQGQGDMGSQMGPQSPMQAGMMPQGMPSGFTGSSPVSGPGMGPTPMSASGGGMDPNFLMRILSGLGQGGMGGGF